LKPDYFSKIRSTIVVFVRNFTNLSEKGQLPSISSLQKYHYISDASDTGLRKIR